MAEHGAFAGQPGRDVRGERAPRILIAADDVRTLIVRAFDEAPCMLDALVSMQCGIDELVRKAARA